MPAKQTQTLEETTERESLVISYPEDHGFSLPRNVNQFDLVKNPGLPAGHWYHPPTDAIISCPAHWSPNTEVPEKLPKRVRKED